MTKHLSMLIKKYLFTLSFLFIGLTVFITPSPVLAQPTCDPAEPLCAQADAACQAISPNPFGDAARCSYLIYEISRLFFAEVTPHPWYNPSIQEFQQKVFDNTNPDEIFGERYTYAQVNWILNSLSSMLFPSVISSPDPAALLQNITDLLTAIDLARSMLVTQNFSSSDLAFVNKYGFIGQSYIGVLKLTYYISSQIDTLPSAWSETKQLASKLNIVSDTFAQGSGYERLGLGGTGTTDSPTRAFWIATRNIALLITTLIIIIAGFMVMFRSKISPQVSVTIQMVIPRIAISIVLVLFSYAIAGFVIDLMYLAISAIIGMLYFAQTAIGMTIITDLPLAMSTLAGGGFDFVWHFLAFWIVVSIVLIILTIVLAALLNLASGGVVVLIAGFILGFFLWSIYVWARIIGQFVVAFITFNLLVVAGPLIIIFDIIPSKKSDFGGFKKWLLCLIGNASIFVTYALLAILINAGFDTRTPVPGFAGDIGFFFNNQANFPLFDMPSNIFVQYAVFVGAMSFAPNIATMVKNMFCKSVDPSDFVEKMAKDTMGQLTSAGQQVSKAKEANIRRPVPPAGGTS